ncbi:Asp-tRNA(Asn)/Glu-tRNA(Gln) amidotransferase subunit GatB [Marine Group I thaumarchaeote]|uniref:Aspartyl/glutamyl-tRNA(Asn/Gln) amidotransferase subunit B n=1 Tax=Marine Group I thaumarchaeote TaxID=2511932 RepID=A0A7K4NYP2_9ARCH|nr:Asp-tRNA(Asn)/Glu-tRNA(Gln) amidotransferase subunit GatB [Marine Group I thaumarchaeote]
MTMIGLEIHCQLTKLESKLFCSCKADYREFEPNTNICPICMGIPGSLPLLNKKAVEKATLIAMALDCDTPPQIAFFRKNYFYPDLPKNFQITQLNADGYEKTSIGWEGKITVDNKKIRIRRIQLEEDPGRLIYEGATERTKITLVDYNRAGTPLVEIVTEPDFENPHQVRNFLNILSDLIENLGVSDPGLDGAMRADANVSIEGGSKVEIKNIGSFHDLEKAVHFEITRQQSLAEREIEIMQETRHWDDKRKITVSARTKEEEEEYRYHLEADIPWVNISNNVKNQLQIQMPENISSKKERYVSKYNIAPQVADILASDKYFSDLFENANNETDAKDIANMITTDLMGLVDTREKREQSKLEPKHLADLIECIKLNKITRTSAKLALEKIVKTGKALPQIIEEFDLGHVSDKSTLEGIIGEVLKQETKAVEESKQNPEILNYLVGKVMQKTQGKADPELTLALLKKNLGID